LLAFARRLLAPLTLYSSVGERHLRRDAKASRLALYYGRIALPPLATSNVLGMVPSGPTRNPDAPRKPPFAGAPVSAAACGHRAVPASKSRIPPGKAIGTDGCRWSGTSGYVAEPIFERTDGRSDPSCA